MGRNVGLLIAGLGAIAGVTTVANAADVSGIIYLRAHVPIHCNIDWVPAAASTGGPLIDLGTSFELCNAPRGYRVVLDHPSDVSSAAVLSGGSRIALDPSGRTVLWDADQPGLGLRQLSLDPGENPSAFNHLGLRIEVKY